MCKTKPVMTLFFHLEGEIYNYIILMFDGDAPYRQGLSMQSGLLFINVLFKMIQC